ncbi:acetoin utilization protein AcuC [Georgenia sp. Z1491]|uniref:acetoin utilization protein AcuC n=1 Tax=Georgenia sp. Z1491 TaxID=3416707 RepID=UPI003CF16C41
MADGALVWSPDLVGYNFGVGHPMSPLRLHLTIELARALGLLEPDVVEVLEPEVCDAELLASVHEPGYVDAVRAAESDGATDARRGIGGEDNPVFGAMHSASARLVGSTVTAARAVWSGRVRRAFSLAGGMHHAMPGHASGFCVYNDVAVAIRYLKEAGAGRIVYLDVDAHHGDGVERVFWDDPDVVTVSVHEHPSTLFPGTGYPQDVGGPGARGSAVNVALPAGTSDEQWLRAVEAVASPIVEAVRPDVLVTQHGSDSHGSDPLTNLAVSVDAQRAAAVMFAGLAERFAGGRWVATGGGGYEVVNVVPRAWSHVLGVVAGTPLDPGTPVPEEWRQLVHDLAEGAVATTMSDADPFTVPGTDAAPAAGPGGPAAPTAEAPAGGGTSSSGVLGGPAGRFVDGFDPENPVDRAILATRQAVFPEHGLDPLTA